MPAVPLQSIGALTSPRASLAVVALLLGAATAPAQPSDMPVRLQFAATVGDTPAACGAEFAGIGTTASTIRLTDFRFYVSRLRLVRVDGSEQPITLAQDGLWQVDDVALLDFEDGSATCANGTAQTRSVVEGRVPAGQYVGVRFDVGLPFDKNHQEPTLAPSPLNLSRMFWSWNAGYKFMRLDIRSTGQPKGWMIHLGSTGCSPSDTPRTIPVACERANRVTVDLASFDVARDIVDLDVKALLASSNVDINTPQTAAGCMSGLTDPECGPLFQQLGLQPGEGGTTRQSAFRARRAGATAP